jgi:hypothetical protein
VLKEFKGGESREGMRNYILATAEDEPRVVVESAALEEA